MTSGADWVNGGRVGEFLVLDEKKKLGNSTVIKRRTTYVEVRALEAGPNEISSLDFERCKAISPRD